MKLRSPKGCVSLSHRGLTLEITQEGAVDVEEAALACLAPHGFEPWADGPLEAIERPPSLDLVLDAADGASGGIRSRFLAGREGARKRQQQTAAPTRADIPASADPISALNRQALFAYLKSKGVSVCLPITNDELRVLARRALNG